MLDTGGDGEWAVPSYEVSSWGPATSDDSAASAAIGSGHDAPVPTTASGVTIGDDGSGRDPPSASSATKCFNCSGFGHVMSACPKVTSLCLPPRQRRLVARVVPVHARWQ